MKKIIILAVALFICLGLSSSSKSVDKWTSQDTIWEVTTLAVKTLDWSQTRYIAANKERYYEVNPLIGQHPSDSEVNRYFIVTSIGHMAVAGLLPTKATLPIVGTVNPRRLWQYIFIGISGGLVAHNANIGIGMKW